MLPSTSRSVRYENDEQKDHNRLILTVTFTPLAVKPPEVTPGGIAIVPDQVSKFRFRLVR